MSCRARWAGYLVLALVCTASATGIVRQRVIADKALDILPDPLAEFYAGHADSLEEYLLEPITTWPRDSKLRKRGHWHYVCLDAGIDEQTRTARMKAAGRFPRSEDLAKSHYRKNHIRRGGLLPWVVANLHEDLVEAFQARNHDDILKLSGHLMHFSSECSSPFNASLNRDGSQTGNLMFGHRKPGEDGYAHQTVAYRIDYELIRRYSNRFAKEIKVNQKMYDPEGDAAGRAFETLMDSLGCLDEALEADRTILAKMQIATPEQFTQRIDEYYIVMDDRCQELCCDRMQAGAILAAGLVGSAWEQAGKPSLDHTVSEPAVAESGVDDNKAPKNTQARFVGSRNSSVFHCRDCSSVKRINPNNLVEYESAEDARKQGKKPCKRCKPSDD